MVEKQATLIIKIKDLVSKNLAKVGTRFQRFASFIGQHKFLFAGLAAGAAFLGKKMIDAADKMEQWSISFETMIGNADKARDLMEEIKVFAAETPFELPDVVKGAKGLLAFGIELEKVVPTLKNLGDVAAGLGVPIERLILNFGQVKAQAKLTGRELRDFAIAGVPLLGELAKSLNKTEAEIQEMVSRGKIGFAEVENAFASMAGAGGRFENLMKKQMTTFTGVVSNAKDQVFQLSAEIGESLLPAAKKIATFFINAATAVRDFIKALDRNAEANANTGKTARDLLIIQQEQLEQIEERIEQMSRFNEQIGLSAEAQTELNRLLELRAGLQKAIADTTKKAVAEINKADTIRRKEEERNLKQKLDHKKKEKVVHTKFRLDLAEVDSKFLKGKLAQEEAERNARAATLNFISTLSTAKSRELAVIGKAAAIVQATIAARVAFGEALKGFGFLGPGAFPIAAAVLAAGLANVAQIAGTPLQEGGIILPRQGGTFANVAEAGKAEAIIPLDDEEAQERLGEAVGTQTVININAGVIVGGEEAMSELASMIDRELYLLQQNRQTVSV